MKESEFKEFRAFATIVEQRSFVKAAKLLQVTPSTLSKIIRDMELRLDVRLLNRTTRSVSLTDTGRRVFERLQPALAELVDLRSEISTMAGRPAGTLRIHSPGVAAALYLRPLLTRAAAALPDVHFDVTVDNSVQDMVAQGFDLGIRLNELLDADMASVRLGNTVRRVAFAAPDYIERHGRPETPADLHQHSCINWRQPGASQVYRWKFHRDNRSLSIDVKGPLTVNDRDLMVAAAIDGVGIGFWIEEAIAEHLASGRLVVLLDDWSPTIPGFHLYYPRQKTTLASVRAFVDLATSQQVTSPDGA